MSAGDTRFTGELEQSLAALGAPSWRERKQAINRVHQEWSDAHDATRRSLLERLFELALGPHLEPRAAARELLRRIGAPASEELDRRMGAPLPSRALVELAGELGDERQVGRLVELLRHREDINLVAAAAGALGSLGGTVAAQALEELLGDPSEVLVAHALDGLHVCAAVLEVERVLPLLRSPMIRRAATAVLGDTRSTAAIDPLIELLDDGMAGVRSSAVLALAHLDRQLGEEGETAGLCARLRAAPPQIRARIRGLVEHRDPQTRRAAMWLCAVAGDPDSVETALAVMDDPAAQQRALELVERAGPKANEPLLALWHRGIAHQQPSDYFRLVAALGPVHATAAVRRLCCDALEHPRSDVAIGAAEALAHIGDEGCLAPLFTTMAQEGPVGMAAAEAFAVVLAQDGNASPSDRHSRGCKLIAALAQLHPDSWPDSGPLALHLCAVFAVFGCSDHLAVVQRWLQSPDTSLRAAAARALGGFDRDGAVAPLVTALRDAQAIVRAAACRSLGRLAASEAFVALLGASRDRDPTVRAAAAEAMVLLGIAPALARLRELVKDPDPRVVVHAIGGLATAARAEDLELVLDLLDADDPELVKAGARALGRFADGRAIRSLGALIRHPRWDVRAVAGPSLVEAAGAGGLNQLARTLRGENDPLVRRVWQKLIDDAASPSSGSLAR